MSFTHTTHALTGLFVFSSSLLLRQEKMSTDELQQEARLTEDIKFCRDSNNIRTLRNALERRGKLREVLGFFGSVHWLMAAADDFVLCSKMDLNSILNSQADASATRDQSRVTQQYRFCITSASNKYEALGRYDLAAQLWMEFVNVYPQDSKALQSLAYVLKRLNRWEDEFKARTMLVEMNPRSGMYLIERSNTLRELGRFQEASDDIAQAQSLLTVRERSRADVLINTGSTLFNLRKYEEAFDTFNTVLQRDGPPHRLALFHRSAVLQMCGKLDPSLQGYRTILSHLHEGGGVPADCAWNCALISQSQSNNNTDGLRRAIEYARLARALYSDQKSITQCQTKITQLIEQHNNAAVRADSKCEPYIDVPVPPRSTRASPLREDQNGKEIEEAWQHLDRLHSECYSERVRERVFPQINMIASHLIRLDPHGRPLYYVLQAQVLLKQKKDLEYMKTLRQVLTLFPESAFTSPVIDETSFGIRLCLAHAAKREGKPDEAIRLCSDIIGAVDKSSCSGPTPFFILNELLRERALSLRAAIVRRESSLPDRDRLIQLNPTNPQYWRERAITYQIAGNYAMHKSDNDQAYTLELNGTLSKSSSLAGGTSSGTLFGSGTGSRFLRRDASPVREDCRTRYRDDEGKRRTRSRSRSRSRSRTRSYMHTSVFPIRAPDSIGQHAGPAGPPATPATPAASPPSQAGITAADVKMVPAVVPAVVPDVVPAVKTPNQMASVLPSKTEMENWSSEQTGKWLASFGAKYGQYQHHAIDHCVNGCVLSAISEAPNDESAFALLHAVKIENKVHCLVILNRIRAVLKVARK